MTHLTFGELTRVLDDARVKVIKLPMQSVNGETPREALLDALNRLLARKAKENRA